MLTQKALKARLIYDPDSGVFTDRYGRERGTYKKGYLATKVGKKPYLLHRLAWLYMTGVWPMAIDHINCVKTDNRWENLREATQKENTRNTIPRPSKSGYKGVEFTGKSYRARIRIANPGKRKYLELGRFATAEEAFAAYTEANEKLYGSFGRAK